MVGDEVRYLGFAMNILHGFYSPPAPDIYLTNGPGYPILIVPFLALNLPLVCITIMNALFYYFSLILVYKALQQFVSIRISLMISLFWAFNINAYQALQYIIAETFTLFLISLIVYNIVKAFNTDNSSGKKKYTFLSGFLIGYLVLTKVIFGYVLLFMLAGSVLLWIFNRRSINHGKGVIILIIALATNVPYLVYTHHLTGKMFYWSSVGGNNLYWMSSPFKSEYGDWFHFEKYATDSLSAANQLPPAKEPFISNHQKDYIEIDNYKGIARDDVFKKMAVNNIKSYPLKFVQNCFCNVGRMFFNFPWSYEAQSPRNLLRLPWNGLLIVLMLFCLYPTSINWRKFDYSLQFLLFFALLYFGGSILGSADIRMVTAIAPILLIWIAFVLNKTMKINMGPWKWDSL
jgi:4-amino-4-deoxy-L-arabinose transferase-like glycosyltransferase